MNARKCIILLLILLIAPLLGTSQVMAQEEEPEAEGPPPYKAEEPHELDRPIVAIGDAPEPEHYWLEDGYALTLLTGEMTFPTALTVAPNGTLYVIEAGYSYGSATAVPRVMEVGEDGMTREVARFPDGPVTGLLHHDGALFAIGGRDPAEVWRVDPATGELTTILTGFPVWGHHFTSQLAIGPDDKLYFAVGYPSNSGVIGLEDFYQFQYLSIFPDARDIPCIDHVLVGQNFETPDPFTDDPEDVAITGAFKRFGDPSTEGEVIRGVEAPGCNGAVFRADTDGSDLEVFATGFRNPFGISFSPDGRLFLIDQGMDAGGSRPISNDPEPMWEVVQNGWYGFPDFPSGFPVTTPGYHPEGQPRPEPLLRDPPELAGRPFFLFVPSCGCMQFAFSESEAFGHEGDMFVTQYGSQFHNDVPRGFRIERLDMDTKTVGDFYINKAPGPNGTAPERPISVAFGGDGTMYLLDFGDFSTDTLIFYSSPLTGGIWRIERTDGADGPAATGAAAQGAMGDAQPVPGVAVPLVAITVGSFVSLWRRRW